VLVSFRQRIGYVHAELAGETLRVRIAKHRVRPFGFARTKNRGPSRGV
jgi:hypothetical protein